MTRRLEDLSDGARRLVKGARSIEEAAAQIASGRSPFGRDLIPGMIPRQGVTVLCGPTGTGKSFFAVHVSACVAGALSWGDQQIEGGMVAYLAGEDRPGIEARSVAVARAQELELDRLAFEIMSPGCIHDGKWEEEVVGALQLLAERSGVPVRLVVLDTLGAVFGHLSANDDGPIGRAMSRLLHVAEALECAVLVIHHPGKDGRDFRGSQSLKDRADAFITLAKGAGGLISARASEKMRNGPTGANVSFRLTPFRLTEGDRVEETLVVTDMTIGAAANGPVPSVPGKETAAKSLPPDTRTALDVLKMKTNGHPISVGGWRDDVIPALHARKARSAAAARQAFMTAKDTLVASELITIDGDTVSVRIRQNASENDGS